MGRFIVCNVNIAARSGSTNVVAGAVAFGPGSSFCRLPSRRARVCRTGTAHFDEARCHDGYFSATTAVTGRWLEVPESYSTHASSVTKWLLCQT